VVRDDRNVVYYIMY